MDELTEKVDELLIRQSDLLIEELRQLISSELGEAVTKQLSALTIQPPLRTFDAPNVNDHLCDVSQKEGTKD